MVMHRLFRNHRTAARRLTFAVLFAMLQSSSGCSKETQPAPPAAPVADASWPNVVLISIDTLRPDHLGCYGYSRKTSPRIDRFAAEGALFENAISSSSWTLPAHCAMLTGLADTVHGCVDMDRRLADEHVTLTERLRAAGYATAGFFSGPALHPVFGLGQGFEKYVDCTSYAQLTAKVASAGQSLDGGVVESRSNADVTNPRVVEQVRQWLRDEHKRPFFLFIHFWDVHFDFIPPPPYDRLFDPDYAGAATGENFFLDPEVNSRMPRRDLEHIIALYDGEIAWTDEHVGKILDELDALGLRDGTIVVLTADHGEEFFEHGRKGHRQTLYDEVIRVPLLVRWPGHVPAAARYKEQSRLIDIVPTTLDLLGFPNAPELMGESLKPLFAGQPLPQDLPAVSELFSVGRQMRSYRRVQGKLIMDEKAGRASVYDLLADPREATPLPDAAAPLPRRLAADRERAKTWLDEFRLKYPFKAAAPNLPPNVWKQLESLGYIGGDAEEAEQP